MNTKRRVFCVNSNLLLSNAIVESIVLQQIDVLLSIPLYQFFLWLYRLMAFCLMPFSPKIKLWVKGRRKGMQHWQQMLQQARQRQKGPLVWLHASSLGEFEQGSPLLTAIRQQYPDALLVVTFFSPSGYEVKKHYSGAHCIGYLPFDGPLSAKQFVELLQPDLVLWVKYDYWFFTLRAIYQRHIPLLLVSAIYRSNQPFFKWYGGMHRKMLGYFSHFFVQTKEAAELLNTVVAQEKITISGDTRFDAVVAVVEHWHGHPLIEQWMGNTEWVVVAGSTWPSDEEKMVHYSKTYPQVKWIIAPHNIDASDMADTVALFPNAIRFSALNETTATAAQNVLIIDNVGMLKYLYKYGRICYIGGGFTGDGVHNVLEAAVYSKPVIHGPEYSKYAEAIALLENGGSAIIESALELEKLLQEWMSHPQVVSNMGNSAGNYVQQYSGATQKVMNYIQANRLCTSDTNC